MKTKTGVEDQNLPSDEVTFSKTITPNVNVHAHINAPKSGGDFPQRRIETQPSTSTFPSSSSLGTTRDGQSDHDKTERLVRPFIKLM